MTEFNIPEPSKDLKESVSLSMLLSDTKISEPSIQLIADSAKCYLNEKLSAFDRIIAVCLVYLSNQNLFKNSTPETLEFISNCLSFITTISPILYNITG